MTETAKAPPGRTRLARLASELLRDFPVVPADLEKRCRRTQRGTVVELACDQAVDARVAWEYDVAMTHSTLTILGPPGKETAAACRDFLVRTVPGVEPAGTSQRGDESLERFVRGELRYLVSWLTLPVAGSGASCSIVACREGAGRGRACRGE